MEGGNMRKAFIAGLAIELLSFFAVAYAQDVVAIHSGKIQGATSAGVTSFKGIPYAAPPVGDLRWEPPQPVTKWKGVRMATEYGHDCMQLLLPIDEASLRTTPAEDCLVLNVWAPARRSGKLPVMVWIYGGGWVNGGSSPAIYDGSQFARDGIVFVSFNYRLGRFGFFAFPALTKENKGGLLGNYGYMDMVAALKWVRRNIAAFDGDPHNVTVFGESAGGYAVHTLMTSPETKGLFERVIVESGGGRKMFDATGVTQGMNGRPSGEQIGVNFARSKGIDGDGPEALKKLRSLSAEAILGGLKMSAMKADDPTYASPMIDGKLAVGQFQTLYNDGKFHHVPMIIGANNLELGASPAKTVQELFAPFAPKAKEAATAFDAAHIDFKYLGAVVDGVQEMNEPARFVARTLSSAGDPAWEYRFSYVADSMRPKWPGAPHATEIPYVFGTVQARYGAAATAQDKEMARQVNAYWANFVKTGNPNGSGLPQWPRYNKEHDELMDFTENQGPVAKPDPWKERLDLTEELATHPVKAAAAR